MLTTLILHQRGYGLKGIYSLEEYYARDLQTYYDALTVGPSHNYYGGRAKADITDWIAYFCDGMVKSFEKVEWRALQESQSGFRDRSSELRNLDVRQRAILYLFYKQNKITQKISKIF